VDGDIDPAEPPARPCHGLAGAGIGLEVGDHRQCFGAAALGLLPDLVDPVGAVHQHHLAALRRQAERHGTADPLRGAGDDRHLAGKASRIGCHHAAARWVSPMVVTAPLGENFS
jgi:hypothetical protein